MIIIVDAYNLLHAIPSYSKILSDKQRLKFIKILGIYAKNKGHKIIIVFDGGSFERFDKEKICSAYVVYSGMHQTADEYIKDYVNAHKAYDMLLVSSDLELVHYVDRLSIPSIGSDDFYRLVKDSLPNNGVMRKQQLQDSIKMTSISDSQVDILMYGLSSVPVKKEDLSLVKTSSVIVNIKKKQINKNERVLLKKLRKL